MTRRNELRAALTRAEAALARAVNSAAKSDGDRAEANAEVETLRAYCRCLHAALIESKSLEPTVVRCLELACELLFSPRTTCWIKCLDGARAVAPQSMTFRNCPFRESTPSPGQAARRFDTVSPPQELLPGDALARRLLIRQAIGLFALTMAYLEYYYLDVQLHIASLMSIF